MEHDKNGSNPHPERQSRVEYRETRADIIAKLKDVPCMDCGKRFPSVCMDFDHRDPDTKVFPLGRALRRSLEAIIEEASKCDVICANCHRIRTWLKGDRNTPRSRAVEKLRLR